MTDDDITREVDEVADEVENIVELAAKRLGISVEELLDRVANEIKARIE